MRPFNPGNLIPPPARIIGKPRIVCQILRKKCHYPLKLRVLKESLSRVVYWLLSDSRDPFKELLFLRKPESLPEILELIIDRRWHESFSSASLLVEVDVPRID